MPQADRDATRRAFSKPAAFVVLTKGLTLKTDLTASRLRELLIYEMDTGLFIWLADRNNAVRAGTVAGCNRRRDGYRSIFVDGKCHGAHRLAWLYVHGEFPPAQIDHIDGDRANNAICNLRAASNADNCQNREMRSDNSSGLIGVCWHRRSGKWQSRIGIGGRRIHLGIFADPEAARAAYLSAKARMHTFHPMLPNRASVASVA